MNFKEDILNKRNATRNMSDDEFTSNLPEMAKQLANIDYHYFYSEEQLNRAWKKLKEFSTTNHYTASQQRAGMELCEYFFPNFYEIKNPQGEQFSDFWSAEKLEKILKWNRSSHSTPYLSELKRGVYFCYGLTKNTMYRPHLAKMICDYYSPKVVLDPCCGWGGRLLGTVASGATYIGFEPNTKTFENLKKLCDFLNINENVVLFNEGAENLNKYDFSVDLILTSPPYYNLEIYSDEPTQSIHNFNSYVDWKDQWLKEVIKQSIEKLKPTGVSCWNVAPNMIQDVEDIHHELKMVYDSDFGLHSSARQANQNVAKNAKTKDATICYKFEK